MCSLYSQAVKWLERNTLFLSPQVRKNKLLTPEKREYFAKVAAQIGNPQRAFPVIQISGSKGKGTTAFFISKLLMNAGERVGTTTSPHLVDQRERALVNLKLPEKEEFARSVLNVAEACDRVSGEPTYSGVMSLAALDLFRRLEVDAVVLECGLGGRNDSTGFVDNEIAVLTSVELEHTAQLGSSLQDIAQEKAGIASRDGSLIYPELPSELEEVIGDTAIQAGAVPVRVLCRSTKANDICYSLASKATELFLRKRGKEAPSFKAPYPVPPGRRDMRRISGAQVLFDGAHTSKSLESLVCDIGEYFSSKPVLIFSTTHGRDAGVFLEILSSAVSEKWYVTRRGEKPSGDGLKSLELPKVRGIIEAGRDYLVTGSFHLVGEVMKELGVSPYSE